jgi:hypothetical protein
MKLIILYNLLMYANEKRLLSLKNWIPLQD